MRRLLVTSLLATASFAPSAPASAADQICAGVSTQGTLVPHTGTDFTCRVVHYPYALHCMTGSSGFYPYVSVQHYVCLPAV